MNSIVNYYQVIVSIIFVIILHQFRPLSCGTPSLYDAVTTDHHADIDVEAIQLIEAIKKTGKINVTDAALATKFLISAEVQNAYKQYHVIRTSDQNLSPATRVELIAVYRKLIARSRSCIGRLSDQMNLLWKKCEHNSEAVHKKNYVSEITEIITQLTTSSEKIEDIRILIAFVDLLFPRLILLNDSNLDADFAKFWNLNIKPHITELVESLDSVFNKLPKGKEGFDKIVDEIPKFSTSPAVPSVMDLLKPIAKPFFIWRSNMKHKTVADQLLSVEDKTTLFSNWPLYLRYISRLNFNETYRETSVAKMNNYMKVFEPFIENHIDLNVRISLLIFGAETLVEQMEDRTNHSIKKPFILPSIDYFIIVKKISRPAGFVQRTDAVIIRFRIQSLVDAFYRNECKYNKEFYVNAFICSEDAVSIQLKVTKDYVAEKAVITFPANVVMQYKERFRERITAYINLLTAKLKEIGQLVINADTKVAIEILKSLTADYIKVNYSDFCNAYDNFRTTVHDIAVANNMEWPKELQ